MDKEQTAIERLKVASEMSLRAYDKPLRICVSGGKDSSVIQELALRAGIPAEYLHSHTTADAPETVYFVRSEFRRLEGLGKPCSIAMPTYRGDRTSMWDLIVKKGTPPTRLMRYCCQILKENAEKNCFVCTGVRWAESAKRKTRGIYENLHKDPARRVILSNDNDDRRQLFENCHLNASRVVNPIIDWTDADVWDFLRDAKTPVNPLYCEAGLSRVGCVGCPFAGKRGRELEFLRWPKYRDAYLLAFGRMLAERKRRGLPMIKMWGDDPTAMDVFNWWMEYDVLPGQVSFEEMEEWNETAD